MILEEPPTKDSKDNTQPSMACPAFLADTMATKYKFCLLMHLYLVSKNKIQHNIRVQSKCVHCTGGNIDRLTGLKENTVQSF